MDLLSLLSISPYLYLSSVGIFGLLFGSFFNVVIYRLPKMLQADWAEQCEELLDIKHQAKSTRLSLISPGSQCPSCGHPIGAGENIPVLSYLLLRGQCRSCKSRISIRYPLIEVLTAAVFVVTAWNFGWSYTALAGIVLTGILIPLTFIDIDHQILPDNITLPGLWMGLIVNSFGLLSDLHSAVIGAISGYLFLWLVYHGFRLLTGKEGMGYGDFKLLAMLGAWLGWQSLPLVILLSASVGAVIGIVLLAMGNKSRDTPIPFGPYLCLAGWIALLRGEELVSWYLGASGLS